MTSGLIIGLSASAAWVLVLILSRAGDGPWPPRRGNWPMAIFAWGATILIYVGVFQTWAADPGALGFPLWIRWVVGGALMTVSGVLQTWGIADLGLKGTSGWDVGLVTKGSYARVRHPQYLGQAIGFVGFGLAAANVPAIVLSAIAVALMVWASKGEDDALAKRDPAFAAYRARVPFFLPGRPAAPKGQPE